MARQRRLAVLAAACAVVLVSVLFWSDLSTFIGRNGRLALRLLFDSAPLSTAEQSSTNTPTDVSSRCQRHTGSVFRTTEADALRNESISFLWPALTHVPNEWADAAPALGQLAWSAVHWVDPRLSVVNGSASPAQQMRYPMTPPMFERSFTASTQCERLRAVFHKLDSGDETRVVVIGGSMPRGVECGERACAWPGMFALWISEQAVQHRWHVSVQNAAAGSRNSEQWAGSDIPLADLIIVDVAINSQSETASKIAHTMDMLLWRLWQLQPRAAVMVVETFRTCTADRQDCEYHCGSVGIKHLPDRPDYMWCEKWWHVATAEASVANHYGATVINYRDAVWPNIADPPAQLPYFWDGLSHPKKISHEFVADVVKYAFERERRNALCKEPCVPDVIRPLFQETLKVRRCAAVNSKGTSLNPAQPELFRPAIVPVGWEFTADRKDKLGWIFTLPTGPAMGTPLNNEDFAIEFTVRFGTVLQLEVIFLRSYENFGSAHLTMPTCSKDAEFVLDGHWTTHHSLPDMIILGTGTNDAMIPFPCAIEPMSTHTVRVVPQVDAVHPKFKLLAINAC